MYWESRENEVLEMDPNLGKHCISVREASRIYMYSSSCSDAGVLPPSKESTETPK